MKLDRLAADPDLVALARARSLERSFQLRLVVGHVARDPETAVSAEDPKGGAARPRTVDEEVDQAVLSRLGQRLGRWAELEQPAFELLDAGAGRARDAKDAHDARVVDREQRVRFEIGLVQDDALRSPAEACAVGSDLT